MAQLLKAACSLLFPQNNLCHLCGRALFQTGERVLCARCADELSELRLAELPMLAQYEALADHASAYLYARQARRLVELLKFGCDRAAGLPLAQGMAAAYARVPALHAAELVVPVPLHASRQRYRGYNQAELLARWLCGHTGLALAPDALKRTRNTAPQSGSTREERLRAMRGAFAASGMVGGKNVLLIDDVYTTGATLTACAESLLEAGARSVSALTAARTP